MNEQELALKVVERRKALGLNQDELAKQVGVSRNYISEIERGVATNISFKVVASLASALGISVDEIINRNDDNSNSQPLAKEKFLSTSPAAVRAREYRKEKRRRLVENAYGPKKVDAMSQSAVESAEAPKEVGYKFSPEGPLTVQELAKALDRIASERASLLERVMRRLLGSAGAVFNRNILGVLPTKEEMEFLRRDLDRAERYFNRLHSRNDEENEGNDMS